MKKLNLRIEDLQIESFATDAMEGGRGTVQGAQVSAAATGFGQATCIVCTRQQCYQPSEPGYATLVNGICIRC
jgi:hypothetical protein